MTWMTEMALEQLADWITERLSQIHNEAIANFRSLAKSTGQRTRSDRL